MNFKVHKKSKLGKPLQKAIIYVIISLLLFQNIKVAHAVDQSNQDIVTSRNQYIREVLLYETLASKYQFYNTELSNYDDVGGDTDDIAANNKELNDFTTQLVQGETTDEGKLYKIYSWVVDNIYYNYDYYYDRSSDIVYDAYGVFKLKKTVCEGYSNLLRYMLLSQNIPAVKITGMALGLGSSNNWETTDITGSNHAWVMAFINEQWVNLDATWDSGNTYKNGQFIYQKRNWRYYMCSNEYLATNHMMQQVNNNIIDNRIKTGLFYEEGNYYFYSNGEKVVESGMEGIYYLTWYDSYYLEFMDADGKIYFDTDIVTFKDVNLLQALIENGYDTNKDSQLNIREINKYDLVLSKKNISDLSGLEYARWTMEELDLSHNMISDYSILKSLSYLYELDLSYNRITSSNTKGFDTDSVNLNLKGNPIKVTKVTLNKKKISLKVNQKFLLQVSISPTIAQNKKVSFTSSNKAVASVSKAGKVTAIKRGTAVITCKSNDGSNTYTICTITVK